MTRVAILGGGIVAMVAALVLKKQGQAVELWRFKQEIASNDNKRVFALNHSALNILQNILIKLPSAHMTAVEKMQVWDGLTGAVIDLEDAHLASIVDETALWNALMSQIKTEHISIVELNRVEECVQNGQQWHVLDRCVDFLVIADGANSPMRKHLKVPCEDYSYHQEAIVAQVKTSKPHANIASQVFTAHGPLAFLPIGEDSDYSMVWSLDTKMCHQLLGLRVECFGKELDKAFDGALGQVINVCHMKSYPLKMIHAKQYIGSNWLLMGDAAHHFHPLAGLGLNAGFGDIKCLIELVSEHSDFSSTLLKKYQRSRRAQMLPLIYTLKLIKNSFAFHHPLWLKMRSFGIDFINQSPGFKKLMQNSVQDI
jgi:2-octaprenylphenol hydroxylase